MATFNINQNHSDLIIIPTGKPTKAHVWKRENGEFVDTGELKTNDEGVQVWNVPATVIQTGSPQPIATKITIDSETEPVIPIGIPSQADGLTISARQVQVSARALQGGATPVAPKSGDAK